MAVDFSALLRAPRETLAIEHKSWLDLSDQHSRGVLAKAIIALANHGGGHIIIGIAEGDGDRTLITRPATLSKYTTDILASIVKKFIDPQFECDLDFYEFDGVEVAIVSVPGGVSEIAISKSGIPDGPIREFRPYVRKPGPKSEEPTTLPEWRALFDRCVRARQADMLDAIRSIVLGAPRTEEGGTQAEPLTTFRDFSHSQWSSRLSDLPSDSPARMGYGNWSATVRLVGDFEPPTLPELKRRLSAAGSLNHSGWPPFVFIGRQPLAPAIVDDALEAWMVESDGTVDGPDHADFWRYTPEGLGYLVRGYQEDGGGRRPNVEIGKTFDLTVHVWRVGEVALHAARMAGLMGQVKKIELSMTYNGLAGRQLVSHGNSNRWLFPGRTARQNSFTKLVSFTPEQAEGALAEAIFPILEPLYALFDFFEISLQLVAEELTSMRRNRF